MVLMEPGCVCSVVLCHVTATCKYASLIVFAHVKLQRQSFLLISTFGFTLLDNYLISRIIPFALLPRVWCVRGGPQLLKIHFGRFSAVSTVALKLFPKKIIQSFFPCLVFWFFLSVSCHIPQTGFKSCPIRTVCNYSRYQRGSQIPRCRLTKYSCFEDMILFLDAYLIPFLRKHHVGLMLYHMRFSCQTQTTVTQIND